MGSLFSSCFRLTADAFTLRLSPHLYVAWALNTSELAMSSTTLHCYHPSESKTDTCPFSVPSKLQSSVQERMDSPPGPTGERKKLNRGVKSSYFKSFLSLSLDLLNTPFHSRLASWVYHLCSCPGSQAQKSLSLGLVFCCLHLEILYDFFFSL